MTSISCLHTGLLWLVLLLALRCTNSTLNCQGATYSTALTNCPDRGAQQMSSGGNVSVKILYATNMPNKDTTGPSAAVSDPFVRLRVGSVVSQTRAIRNDLNPVWNEELQLGVLGSATLINVEIWDKDSGLEFSDDLMLTGSFRVPFCSYFQSNYTTETCDDVFNCYVEDSLWQMPTRKLCSYTGLINFGTAACASSRGKCLHFEVNVVPFIVNVELTYSATNLATPQLTVAGTPNSRAFTKEYGYPFSTGSTTVYSSGTSLDMTASSSALKGALMLRHAVNDKSYGAANAIKYYASSNFPATIYVCRFATDNTNGVPTWITREFSDDLLYSRQLVTSVDGYKFPCYTKAIAGTVKNRWGGVSSGAIAMRTNTIAGRDTNSATDKAFYRYNYIFLAIPRTIASREDEVTIQYDAGAFVDFLGSYGLIALWFCYLVARFLQKIDYRVDRLSNYVITRVLTGDDRNLIATLFLDANKSEANVEYRAHLYHMRNVFGFVLVLPLWLILSWGLCCAFKVRPRVLGIGVAFGGVALCLFWFGYRLWERSKWRLSLIAATALCLSVGFHSLFLLVGLFVDDGVLHYGYDVDITGLSLIFGTLNVIPCLLLVFKHDRTHKVYMTLVMDKLLAASRGDAGGAAANFNQLPASGSQVNKVLHSILGETYSINPNVPALRYAAVLNEVADSFHNLDPSAAAAVAAASGAAGTGAATSEKREDADTDDLSALYHALLTEERRLYLLSLAVLFVYLMIAVAKTQSGSLAFLNICALLLLDFVHLSMSKGENSWSPGFKVLMLVVGRLLICGSPMSIWAVNYSACYYFYAVTLLFEIVNLVLPKLSDRLAGQIVFGGEHQQTVQETLQTMDMSGNPAFCLGVLTLSFAAIVVVSVYLPDSGGQSLAVPTITVLGMTGWRVYYFGLIALIAALVTGLAVATQRAFALDAHGLLKGWAKEMYLFRPDVKLPFILAASAELALLLAGLLVYAITDAAAVLVGCVFLPAIFLCLGRTLKTWLENDFELVPWPRRPPKTLVDGVTGEPLPPGAGGDLENAYSMVDTMFGQRTSSSAAGGAHDATSADVVPFEGEQPESHGELPEAEPLAEDPDVRIEKTLKGFSLPPLVPAAVKTDREIKMPPLPLKSVLRRKRQNLGVKTQGPIPIVQDLRARDTATAPDQFGNKADILNIDDPWAQFEVQETETLLKKKKKVVTKKEEISVVRQVNIFLQENKTLQLVRRYVRACWTKIQRRVKVYPKIYRPDIGEGGENDDELDERVDGEEDDEAGPPKEVDVNKLPFWDAFWGGYLSNAEYSVMWHFFGGLTLIMFFGVTLAQTVRPQYLGYVVWIAWWQFTFVAVPMVKFFNVYRVEADDKRMLRFAAFVHFMFCVCFFAKYLGGSIQLAGSLWLFDFFVYFPIVTYIVFLAVQWADNGFRSTIDPAAALAKARARGDNSITLAEVIMYLKSFPSLVAMLVLLNWHFYTWLNYVAGICFTLVLLVAAFVYYYLKDWADNDYFLSPELASLGKYVMLFSMFIAFCVALFRPQNPTFAWSVFFFIWMFRYVFRIAARVMIIRRGTYFFASPYLMPVYSYNAASKDLFDESELMHNVCVLFLLGVVWGWSLTVFFYPLHIGIAISSGFLLVACSAIALSVTYIPRQLAKVHAFILPESVAEALTLARAKFHDRRLPLSLEMRDFETLVPDAVLQQDAAPKTLAEKLKEKTCLENCVALMADVRFLKYVRADKEKEAAERKRLEEEAADRDEFELAWYAKLAVRAKDFARDLWELLPVEKLRDWRKHNQAPFNVWDGFVEIFFRGRGPFGLFGLGGRFYRFLIGFKDSRNCVALYPKWTEHYSPLGVDRRLVDIADPIDYASILARVRELDRAVDHTYAEEARCAVHFLMMVLVSADAKLEREKVLFQKFLRENRYKLASNGIAPPRDIFGSSSYASINIPLTAIWLLTLTREERERFHLLKQTFNAEQVDRDYLVDRVDLQMLQDAQDHREATYERDRFWAQKLGMEILKMREAKIKEFVETLEGPERQKFLLRRDLWASDPECFVDVRDKELYDRFRAACLGSHRDEILENAVQSVVDCETAQRDIRLGEYGRQYQFVDSEFMPSEASVGPGEALSHVLGWRCAPGIVEKMDLFEGGTHPDDICQGVFSDGWLLSALGMLVAAGSHGQGLINDQIRDLFLPHPATTDGTPTLDTEVGAYCVRIHRNSEWIPVLVDDLLPMRQKDYWTNENRGVAGAHVRECRGLWVPLIEKAFAKYFGSYTALEKGFVHHALQDLTGCEAECLCLSPFARGTNKAALWDTLLEHKRNGYILGAGSSAADMVDADILDMGVRFNAAYIIYDVKTVDTHRLIKLRNPPGDHEEWKGDWSDHSPLWTKRLKHKAGYRDNDRDNTFFMSFDDFLNVFRYLYVCKYYNPRKWIELKHPGAWRKADEAAVEQLDMMNQFLLESGEGVASTTEDIEAQNRKKAKARTDSAGGLPSRHNPACILENNPHYSLRIFRPTDLRITVTQYQPKDVRTALKPQPFSVIVVRNAHPTVPMRLKTLKKEDVLYSTGEPKAEKTLNLYINDLGPGLYMVLVGAYVAGMEGRFQFSILSNYRCDSTPVWPPAWMLKDEELPGAEAGEKGGEKTKRRLMKGGAEAKKGIESMGIAVRSGIKALFGGGAAEMDDDDDDASKNDDEDASFKKP